MEPTELNMTEELLPAQPDNENPSNQVCPSCVHGIVSLIAFIVNVIGVY